MHKLALILLAGTLPWGAVAQAQADSRGRDRMGVVLAYLEAAAQSEALLRMECGRFMLAGDRLNWEQAVSEARAKLPAADRERLDKVLELPSSIELQERTFAVPPKNLKILMSQGFSLDYACGLMSGMTLERNSAKIERFRALD